MPGPGLFRVKEVHAGGRPVNTEAERVRVWNNRHSPGHRFWRKASRPSPGR